MMTGRRRRQLAAEGLGREVTWGRECLGLSFEGKGEDGVGGRVT
jgi:hypothetical protein